MQNTIRQLGTAFLGFLLGACAMFWLPWAMSLVFRRTGGIIAGGFARMLGMHLVASILLGLAWILVYAARLLISPPAGEQVSLRRQFILGAMGAGLFYLLYPMLQDSPWVVALVVVIAAAVLGGMFFRGGGRSGDDAPGWTRYS